MNDSRVTSKDLALAILFSASNISLKAVKETAFIPAMETFLDGVDSGALEALLKTYNVRTSGEVYYVPQGATVPEIELNQPFVSLTAQEQSLPLDGDAEIVLVAATQLAIARTGSEAAVVATEDILKSFLLAAKQKIPLPGLGLFSELNPEFHTVVDPMLEKLKPKPELVRTNYAADIGHVGEDGVDTLDVNPYTQAFARLILDKAVAPPLSIGLFGDWGSGKSYFMSLMDCEIVSLAKQASIQPQFGGVYYSHPMVVHFNAWHYVETNLWASLVNVIFTALETELSDAKDKAPDAKDKAHADFIFGKMQSIREAERELEKRKKELDNARLVLAEVSRNQEQKRGELSGLLKFGGWAKLVIDQLPKDAKEKLNKFSSERGFRDPHEVVRQLAEATGQRGGIRRVLQLLLAIFRQHPMLFGFGGVALFLLTVLILAFQVPSVPSGLFESPLVVAWVLYLAKALPKIAELERSAKEVMDAMEAAQKKRAEDTQKELESLEANTAQAKIDLKAAELALETAKAFDLTAPPAQRLINFVQQRVESGDYRGQLGLISTIRKDFEDLEDVMNEIRNAQQSKEFGVQNRVAVEEQPLTPVPDDGDTDEANGKIGVPYVDRIVLFIDDLDRCPPDKVVQVLEAVHLLLAFRLFVVVVAVDTRWVHRALLDHYPLTLADDDGDIRDQYSFVVKDGVKGTGANPRFHGELLRYERHTVGETGLDGTSRAMTHGSGELATPHDYLEKIFQIPFWLPTLSRGVKRNFVDSVTAPFIVSKSVRVTEEDDDTAEPNLPRILTPQSGLSPIDVPEEEEVPPPSLTLAEHERAYLLGIATNAGDSPRRLKRFVNIYHFIKAGLTPTQRDAFTPEDDPDAPFRAVIVLLAVITGAPRVAPDVLMALSQMDPRDTGYTIEGLADKLNNIYARSSPAKQDELENALTVLKYKQDELGTTGTRRPVSVDALRKWVGHVSRFTFRSGRVLAGDKGA